MKTNDRHETSDLVTPRRGQNCPSVNLDAVQSTPHGDNTVDFCVVSPCVHAIAHLSPSMCEQRRGLNLHARITMRTEHYVHGKLRIYFFRNTSSMLSRAAIWTPSESSNSTDATYGVNVTVCFITHVATVWWSLYASKHAPLRLPRMANNTKCRMYRCVTDCCSIFSVHRHVFT